MKQFKIATVCFALSISLNSQADVNDHTENLGDKPNVFSNTYFQGQWKIENNKDFDKAAGKNPLFVSFSSGNYVILQKRKNDLVKAKERTEMQFAFKAIDNVREVHTEANLIKYIDDNFTQETYDKEKPSSVMFKAQKNYHDFVEFNNNNVLVSDYYNKNNNLFHTKAYSFFKYKDIKTFDNDVRLKFLEVEYAYRTKYSFEIKEGVDFFMLGGNNALYGIDVIDNNQIIFYRFNGEGSFMVMKRADKNYETKTYTELFKEISDKEKDAREERLKGN